jgi:hypothetical protein
LPYIAKECVLAQMAVLNGIMRDVAQKEGILFVEEVLEAAWSDADFQDYSHFNSQGCGKFAKILATFLQSRGLFPEDQPK